MVTDLVSKYKSSGFAESVRQAAQRNRSWLCLGLDPDRALLPQGVSPTPQGIVHFCRALVDATRDYVAAYKLNFAFYEALGTAGWTVLQQVRDAIPAEIPVIADAKRGDIPNTARAYAEAIFDVLRFDAVTVTPYVGWDSVAPFAAYGGKGVFIVCKTSNPGSSDLQNGQINGEPLYMRVARGALSLKVQADIGLVVGATQPDALRAVRSLSSELLILAPGVGSQGASATEAVRAGANEQGDNLLANASRSIAYVSRSCDYAWAAARASAETAAETWLRGQHASNR